MKILDANGNITMFDSEGFPHIIASVKHGITYGAKDDKDMGTVMVTILPGHNGLQDNFIFYDKKQPPFTFIQSRSLNPNLKKIYAGFIVNESDQSWDSFLSMVMADYFIKLLGYSHPNYTQFKSESLD
jgi:hypothetical protein